MDTRTRSNRILAMCVLLCSLPIYGQSTAELRGKVVGSAHQPVVSAFVVITSQDASFMRAATTDDRGEFEFAALPVGTYALEVKADGFATYAVRGIRASIGQVVRLDVDLSKDGFSSTRIHVAASSMVETTNAQLGVVMDSLSVTQLPLKSRDTFDLLQLQPGVQGTVGADLFFGNDQPGVVSVNGGRSRSNNNNVNGGNAGDPMINSPSLEPSPDSISEFRVISHNYDADLGRNSGSVLNVITKSGGGSFRGSIYEFLRNNTLNARGYFDPVTPDFKQNDFGGTLGGPVRRDKTFFFSSYEARRVRQGISTDPVVVPTSAERAGDFSAGPAFAGMLNSPVVAQALVNRPRCRAAVAAEGGAPISAGTPYAAIFPGNQIPTECFDPTAADLLNQFVPLATTGNTYRSISDAKVRQDQLTFRLDHNLTSQQQLSFYYYGADGSDVEPFSRFLASGANVPGFGNETRARFQQFNLSHTWTITAKTINEARFVYYRNGQGKLLSPVRTNLVQDSCSAVPASQCFTDPSNPALGISPGYGATREGVPFVTLYGGFAYGNNQSGNFSQTGNVYQGLDTYSRILDRHTLKAGFDVLNQRMNQFYFYDINGGFYFTGGGPNDPGFSDLVPNYLLGLPDIYGQGSANGVDVRTRQTGLFVQDAWKVKPNLTLNYGLRWEWNTPQADAGHRVQAFRPGQPTAVFPCVLSASDPLYAALGSDCSPTGPAASVFPLGMVFPGDRGVPAGLTNNYFKAFAPRLGLAWSPAWSRGWLARLSGGPGKSSIRMGWGMFYDSNEELTIAETFTAQPPFGGSTNITNTFFNTPFLGQNGSITPNPFHGFLDPKPGSPVDFALFRPITLYGNFPNTLRTMYSAHYHVTGQRELTRDTIWQFGYVGSQGHRLLGNIDQNYGTAQTCLDLSQIPGMSCGPFGADSAYVVPANAIPAGVTLHLPYGSIPAVTGPNPNPITLVGLRRYSSPLCEPATGAGCPPDGVPVFASIFGMMPLANSSYNAFQTLINQRMSHGLEFLASYTWSHSFDNASSFENAVNPIDPAKSRSPSLFDAHQRLVLSEYWRIPDSHFSGWPRHLANGWALSSILTLQTGFPIRITSSSDRELMSSLNFETPGEPDQIAPLRRLTPQSSGRYFFDPSSFVDAPLGQIGNAPRTICCGPGIANLDLALHKIFAVRESTKLEFRAESFNAFNHTQFFSPDGNITDGTTFGQVSRARDPRLIQLAMRLTF